MMMMMIVTITLCVSLLLSIKGGQTGTGDETDDGTGLEQAGTQAGRRESSPSPLGEGEAHLPGLGLISSSLPLILLSFPSLKRKLLP